MSFFGFSYNNHYESDSDSDIPDNVSEASTTPGDFNTGIRFNQTPVQQPDYEGPTPVQQEDRDNGPNKVFTIVGCVIIIMFLLKEILMTATLLIMLNLLGYAVDPVNTQKIHKLNVAAAEQLHQDIQRMRGGNFN